MIQDIAPHKLNNHYEPGKQVSADSPCVCFYNDTVCVSSSVQSSGAFGDVSFLPTYADFGEGTPAHYLFTYDEKDLFLVRAYKAPDGFEFVNVKDIRRLFLMQKHEAFLLMTAYQVENWYLDNAFCGRCSAATVHSPKERAVICPNCGRTIYPRILPAVIVAVTYNGRILLTKYEPRSGQSYAFYALVAGFTEIGETLEECVAREVMEETGLPVKNVTYYKSQPWGVVDDLLMGFYCEADTEAMEALYGADNVLDDEGWPTIHLDRDELRKAVWLKPEEMELQPDVYSLTNEMMMLFKAKKVASPADVPTGLTRADIEGLEHQFYDK